MSNKMITLSEAIAEVTDELRAMTPLEFKAAVDAIQDLCCKCCQSSDVGCHGVSNGKVTDEYFCIKHWHEERRKQ